MPELPEVETVRRGLAPAMEGATIARLELNRPDLRFPLPENFAAAVEGRAIVSLGRRAKYLLIELEQDLTLIAHLGMSGSFRVEDVALGEFHVEDVVDEALLLALRHLTETVGCFHPAIGTGTSFGHRRTP